MILNMKFLSCLVLLIASGCSTFFLESDTAEQKYCYESEYMKSNLECLDAELQTLEEKLSSGERSIYEMAKEKLSDKYQKVYFLRLSPHERRRYLAYIYNGEPPVYYKNSLF